MKKVYLFLLVAMMFLVLAGCTENQKYQAGSYSGSAQGKNGPIKVDVTFTADKIESVKVVSHQDDLDYAIKAVEGMPEIILDKQRLDVDAVSGATLTSRGIVGAVAQCVTDAGIDPEKLGFVSVDKKTDGQEIQITGLAEDKIITGDEIKAMTPVEFDAISVDASGTQTPTKGKGVKLESILSQYGESQKNYDAIVLNATDGYAIEIPRDVLAIRDVIIAYEINGAASDLRTVVPDERAMYWVKFLNKIDIKGAIAAVETENLVLLETAVLQCTSEEYKYYDALDQAISISQLLEKTGVEKADSVDVTGIDGWARTENYNLYAKQYIKITGENTPMFIGPDLPEGMRMKDMLSNKIGKNMILSVTKAQEKYGSTTVGGQTGVSIERLFQELKIKEAPNYILKGADGQEVQISLNDLKKGILCLSDKGVNSVFEGLGNDTSVTGLLSIKALQ
ncbi:MAG: FMN-binding protein [Acetobacterium sp.]|nr:FMN-binding protein [Acetobacterium sp.]